MRVAVAGRPAEPFDTELKLPEWQLEPDDQAGMGNPDAYFSPDDQGNLVGPDGQPVPQPQQGQQRGCRRCSARDGG
jgi:penicillin-binding protein 1A